MLLILIFIAALQANGQISSSPAIRGRSDSPKSPLLLWYRSPSAVWTDALPIGNGRLGAMVFGVPAKEHLQLNDVTVWSGGPQPDQNRADAYKALPAIRGALAAGNYAEATKLVSQNLTTPVSYPASYKTLGDLDFDFDLPAGPITDYWRWLDLNNATTGVEFRIGKDTYRRESFASNPDHALVTHITCSRPGAVSFTLRLSRIVSARTSSEGTDTLVMRGNTDIPATEKHAAQLGDVTYEARTKVMAKGGSVKAVNGQIVVQSADEVTVLLVAGTSYVLDYDKGYKAPVPHEAIAHSLTVAAAKPFARLRAEHIADYQSLFNRVKFELPDLLPSPATTDERIKDYGDGSKDPALAVLYYQMGRYLLIASSREDNPLPANTQGIWGDGLDLPWKADYKANINYEMCYWPSETAGLSEMHMPAIRLDASLVKPGQKTAKAYYDAPGWVVAFTTNSWGWTAPGAGMPWGAFFGGGGWLMQDIWEHYAFTRDKAYLDTYYPVMKGSAQFYLGILVTGADGMLSLSPSLSPENTFKTDTGMMGSVSDNTAIEREIVWDLFTNTIAAQKLLGIDPDLRVKLETAKAKLRPLEIGKDGQLEEWGHDWDMNGDLHHRHVSNLYGAFPGWEISPLRTPELADAVKRSLEIRGDISTGWSNAWKINLWAHMRDGNHAFNILSSQLRLVSTSGTNMTNGGGTYADMLDAHPPFQIDGNFGSTSGIDEMLLQSSDRYEDQVSPNEDRYYIDLLPALPSLWADGSITGLRARGGFQVDLVWKAGRLNSAIITSIAGTQTIVRYNGLSTALDLKPGASVRGIFVDGKLFFHPTL